MESEKEFRFEVEGTEVVGTLYQPPQPTDRALVFTGPLTSVKEQVTANYARALAREGFACLSFDHRFFGQSGGEPRQYESPPKKVQDIRAAVIALKEREGFKHVGAVGVCAGAGYMARAVADEPAIEAFGAVAGFFHDASKQKQWMGERYQQALDRAARARAHYEATGVCETIPAVGEGDVAMPLPEAAEYYGTERGAIGGYVNEFAILSRADTLPFDAQSAADQIRVPTLLIHSDNALAPALAKAFYERLAGPKELEWTESKGQIDFYDDPDRIGPASKRLAAHFAQHLR